MLNGKTLRAAAALTALLALGGCDTAKGLFSMAANADQPQDDSVKRPPLTLPPDYNLRPPSATAATATDFTASQQGRATVFGLDQEQAKQDPAAGVKRQAGLSLGESALLQHAGASTDTPGIRQKVNQETENLNKQEKAFSDTLIKGTPQDQQAAEQQKKSSSGGWFSGLGSIFSSTNADSQPTMQRKDSGGIF